MKKKMNNKIIPPDVAEVMIKDRQVRVRTTKESFVLFFHFYFDHYVTYDTADFQKEMMDIIENDKEESLFVVAFRGSGKSTIITTAYPIWAILGKEEKKFVTIYCQTQTQAKQHMMNLRRELESNEFLKKDLGPFREESEEWGSHTLVFSNTKARITVSSAEQSIRGIRHHEHRPDLIICDDVEDMSSAKTREGREKTYNWLRGEVIPSGDKKTRLVIVGNLLHEDSLLMRIKSDIEEGRSEGIFKSYPLIQNDVCLWPEKYPTEKDIEREKMKLADDITWQREYLLRIVPSDAQLIHPNWIHYYDVLPKMENVTFAGIRIGVDLAISQRDTADYTSMVSGWICWEKDSDDYSIYVLPDPINKKMTFPETVDTCKDLHKAYVASDSLPEFVIEDVAYQRALPQQLEMAGLEVMPMRPGNQDKRSRLALTTHKIKRGKILFPKEGCEELLSQLIHFGVEKHDDLADAFSMMVLSTFEDIPSVPDIHFLGEGGHDDYDEDDDDYDYVVGLY